MHGERNRHGSELADQQEVFSYGLLALGYRAADKSGARSVPIKCGVMLLSEIYVDYQAF